MDTLGNADAPAACIVMESSGRAGPSVTGNASRREGNAEEERHPWSGENVGNPVRRSAGTRDLMSAQFGFFTLGHPRTPGKSGMRGKSVKIQILRRNGSSGRQKTKIQLILRNF